ncbi:MAG: hypothetical protein WB783_13020 [Arenicellales bacterium]
MGIDSRFDEVFPLLSELYSEPGRHYHNLDHVCHCLARVDEVREYLRDTDAVELALWFHDAVYVPSAHDNELRSALLFDRLLGVHLPTERADRIHTMIMATVHPSGARDDDSRFVADIDLSGFALPRPDFLRATGLLRRECLHLTDSEFQLGTLAFFKKVLARPSIYLTKHFRATHEQPARRNLIDLVEELELRQGALAGR